MNICKKIAINKKLTPNPYKYHKYKILKIYFPILIPSPTRHFIYLHPQHRNHILNPKMDPESQPPTNVEEEVKSEPTPSKDILEQYLSSLEKM